MIKRFCDFCGAEITNKNWVGDTGRFKAKIGKKGTLHVEVKTGFNRIMNEGDFCKYCVIDAVNGADDRPT